MNKETRYIVLKNTDCDKYLTYAERNELARLLYLINNGREQDNKLEFNCVVVEQDWPEYPLVWDLIEARVNRGIEYQNNILFHTLWTKMAIAESAYNKEDWIQVQLQLTNAGIII